MATANLPKPVAPPKTRLSSFERTLQSARSTMMFSEIVKLAIDSFKASKVRFLLTMLGMIIGSASIILVYTLWTYRQGLCTESDLVDRPQHDRDAIQRRQLRRS